MAAKIELAKGKWYYRFDMGKNFTVMDVDEVECVVAVRYLDGEIDEIKLEEWDNLDLQKAE